MRWGRGAWLLAFGLTIASSTHCFAYAKDDYDRYVSEYAAARTAFNQLLSEYRQVEQQYAEASSDAVVCRTSIWASVFKKPVEDMDAERKKLEAARLDLDNRRRSAETDRSAIERDNGLLRLKAAQLGDAYWVELEAITDRMHSQYIEVLQDLVMVGYRQYIAGVKAAIKFVDYYRTECAKPFLGRDIARVTVENAGEIIKEVADVVAAIKKVLA